MTLTFTDGIVTLSAIGTLVYLIVAWQIRRCSSNVNEFNLRINAIVIRQTLIAEHHGIKLPPMDTLMREMGSAMPKPPSSRHACVECNDDTDILAPTPQGGPE